MDNLELLKGIEKQVKEAYELYWEKHEYSTSKSRSRAYYKGKQNMCLDVLQLIESMKEKVYNETNT